MTDRRVSIGPIHHSVIGKRILPRDMDRAKMDRDNYEGAVNIALSIFADCTNVGVSFQDALLAIYISGLNHGATITKENYNG